MEQGKVARHKIDTSDPRARLALVVSNIAWFVFAIATVWRIRTGRTGPDAPKLVLVAIIAMCVVAAADARNAWLFRSAHKAIGVPLYMFGAFAAAAGRSDDFDPPTWLTGIAIAVLVVTIGAAVPFAIYTVHRVQDERERKILMSAMSIAFMLTMVILVTFVVLQEYTTVHTPSVSWVLLAAAASWFASYFVLRERM